MSHTPDKTSGPIGPSFGAAEQENARALIGMALREDLGTDGDLTARLTIPAKAQGRAAFVARADGVLAGLPVVALLADHFDLHLTPASGVHDGMRLSRGHTFATVAGSMRDVLAFERTALNFLQRLSGVATLTARFVAAVKGTNAQILDTRKTTPGWRILEKYAVRCGGGRNHRIGLYDAVLIKDNHLAWLATSNDPIGPSFPEGEVLPNLPDFLRVKSDPIGVAVGSARVYAPSGTVVEIEVDSLAQLDRALSCRPDVILLDNFVAADMAEAVRRRDARMPGILLEASGGVSLETVRGMAETGVDRISVGALTHSAPALDIALDGLPA